MDLAHINKLSVSLFSIIFIFITCLAMVYLQRLLEVIYLLSLVLRKAFCMNFLHIFLVIFLRETQNMQLWSQNSCIYSIAFDTAKSFQKFSVESAHFPTQLAMLGSKELTHEQDNNQDSLSGVLICHMTWYSPLLAVPWYKLTNG